ncbi:MAG: hemerythrin domain-containing protein [Rhodoferax sp.]|jgi:hemerythrin-like metal-binding protein|nr:hemerythrin domain-containing protein [Rhodoferax sp.]
MTTTTLQWDDSLLLGEPQMDRVHQEFVELVARMERAGDDELAPLLEEFATHTRAHFEMENQWMTETAFPPRECHIDEHAAVMKSVDEVRVLLAQGNTAICRGLIQELVRWFPSHAHHLDSALAHWVSKLRTGGKPVVIRRGLTLR